MTITEALKSQHHLYHNLQQDTFANLFSLTPSHISKARLTIIIPSISRFFK
jgi:hypothetical protein